MRLIQLGEEAQQRFTISNNGFEADILFRFLPVAQQWIMNVTYSGKTINGVKMATGVLHMDSQGYPFDFYVRDTTGNGIDPYRLNDFQDGRCEICLIEPEEMEELRGYDVEIS